MNESRKLKVGLVFDDSLDSADGVAQHVKTVGAWLSARGHEVRYLVGQTKLADWHGGKVYSLAKNQTVYFNGNRLSIPWPVRRQRLVQVLKAEQFDVLHVMMPHSPFMAQRLLDLAGLGVAAVGTFHIFPSGWLASLGGRALRLAYFNKLKRFDEIVSVSQAAQAYARQTFGISSKIIPNPVNVSALTQTKQQYVAGRIVFLGRLVKRKGCQQLIEAFAQLQTYQPDARLIVAGDGPQRQKLQAQTKRLGIEDKVEFKGFIDEAQKPRLLASAQVACFPSLYGESFGIVLIEAMAAGARVVLGGNNPGYASVLQTQPELLVNPLDIGALAKRLNDLMTDKTKAAELNRWQQSAVKNYDINIVGQQIVDMYLRAIAKRTKTSHNIGYGTPKSNS